MVSASTNETCKAWAWSRNLEPVALKFLRVRVKQRAKDIHFWNLLHSASAVALPHNLMIVCIKTTFKLLLLRLSRPRN